MTAAYVPGFATGLKWAVLTIALPPLLLTMRWHWTEAHKGLLAFAGYALVSILWAPSLVAASAAAFVLLLALLAFQLGVGLSDLRPVFIGASLGLVGSLVIVVHYQLGFATDPNPPGGLFADKNSLGEVATLVAIGTLAYGLWWLAPVPLATAILSGNRGAVLGLAAASVVVLWGRSGYALGAALLVVFIASLALLAMTSHGGMDGFTTEFQRAAIWRDALRELDWLGHGIGSYRATITAVGSYTQWRPLHAHSDWLQLVYVYGVGVLLLIPFVVELHHDKVILVLVGVAGLGLVQSPASNPAALFIMALCFGRLARGEVVHEIHVKRPHQKEPSRDGQFLEISGRLGEQ